MPSKKTAPAALVPVLPGEAEEDDRLVDQAVQEINRRYTAKGLETARELGEYLIDTFFDGDPEKFHLRGAGHASFRQLAKREDLLPSSSFLWKACAIVEQLRQLPEDVAAELPVSHHKLLLSLKDVEAKKELAQRAATEKLSKRDLEAQVKAVRANGHGGPKAGRPPLPEFVKGLHQLRQAVKLATATEVSAQAFVRFDTDKARDLLNQLEADQMALAELKAQVERALAEFEDSVKG